MPTIAIVAGVRIVIYLNDHLPPHIHALFSEHEAKLSILTGDILGGSLPASKGRIVKDWLAAHRGEVAWVWREIRAGRYAGGRIE